MEKNERLIAPVQPFFRSWLACELLSGILNISCFTRCSLPWYHPDRLKDRNLPVLSNSTFRISHCLALRFLRRHSTPLSCFNFHHSAVSAYAWPATTYILSFSWFVVLSLLPLNLGEIRAFFEFVVVHNSEFSTAELFKIEFGPVVQAKKNLASP